MKHRITIVLIALCFLGADNGYVFAQSIKEEQLRYPRVRDAYKEKETLIRDLFLQKQINYPPQNIFIRIFKEEEILELWARSKPRDQFTLIKEYKICHRSGDLGPKRREGDSQVPEGFYHINGFNPQSAFHLSLRINYPNDSDRVLSDRQHPGGDIFIHGNCVTIGCIPITDENIKELYLVAVEARNNGQRRIPVHIFPKRLSEGGMTDLRDRFKDKNNLISFWENLREGCDYFERNHQLPTFRVRENGSYLFAP